METWDAMGLPEYLAFTAAWLGEVRRLVKPTGSIWIHGTYHNVGLINCVLQGLGIEIINEVVWYKRNAFPNLAGRRLTASHETILWAHTGGSKRQYFYNAAALKDGSFPEDAIKRPGKQMRTVWDIPNNKDPEETALGKHPSQKPLRLLRRMLLASAQAGQLCIAPFAGVGSECVAAAEMGLDYIGFETDGGFCETARKRLSRVAQSRQEASQSAMEGMASPTLPDRLVLLPERLREAMASRGISTVAALARGAEVSRTKIHQYLRGEPVLATTYLRLCAYLGVAPESLVGPAPVGEADG
jgi:DNA modification methylase